VNRLGADRAKPYRKKWSKKGIASVGSTMKNRHYGKQRKR
jgi:hypothetical protein